MNEEPRNTATASQPWCGKEPGHVLLHSPADVTTADRHKPSSRARMEVEAESVAFLVAAAHGLDTSSYSFPYVGGWMPRKSTLETTLRDTAARVLGTAHAILERLDRDKPDFTLPAEDRAPEPLTTAPRLDGAHTDRRAGVPVDPHSAAGAAVERLLRGSPAVSTPALNNAATPPSARPRRDQSWRQQPQHRPGVNAYARDRYQQQQAGAWAPFTPTAPVREHIDQLREAGMTSEQIAHAGGVSVSTLARLFKATRMTAVAADAILAVQAPQRSPEPGPDPTRQLQALVADGWNLEQLAEASGINERTAWQTVHGYTTPSPRTIAAVDALYEDLKLEDPGDGAAAVRSRLRAERQGWTSTTIDPGGNTSPEGIIDEVAVDRVVHGEQVPLRSGEQQAALRRLAGAQTDDEIGRRLGIASRTVLRHRTSQGLPAYGTTRPIEGPAR